MYSVVLAVIVCFIALSCAAKLPPQFKKCLAKDKECLRLAIEGAIKTLDKGIPSVGLTSLSPLKLPELTVGAGKSVVNLQQFYKNVNIWGTTAVTVTDVDLNLEKGILNLELSYPGLKMEAEYKMMGRILVLPVFGHGNCSIILGNAQPSYNAIFEIISKNGKKFIKIKSQTYHLNAGSAKYYFDNFFHGDKVLGEEINKVLNDNWKEIYDEVVPGYETAIGMLLTSIANRFFAKVSISELFLPEK